MTMEMFSEKLSASTGSGKEIAGLLKKKIDEYDDMIIAKSRMCGFLYAKPECVYKPVGLIARSGSGRL